MKKIVFSLFCILLLSVFCFGQKNKKSPEINEPAESSGNKSVDLGTNIQAQLESTLDVKKSQVGDPVVLKTTKTIKDNGQVVLQKGTRLIGRVTEVQQRTKDNAMSKIGLVIDRIEGQNLTAPLNATIVSITRASGNANIDNMLGSDVSGNSTSSGSVSRGGSSSGGLLGGSGGLLSGATNTVGGVVNSTTQTVGGVTNTVGQTTGGVTQALGSSLNGIQLSNSLEGSAQTSSTISSSNKNLKIEKGAVFQLRLNQSVEN